MMEIININIFALLLIPREKKFPKILKNYHTGELHKNKVQLCTRRHKSHFFTHNVYTYIQGTNARKGISEVYAFCTAVYLLSLGGKVNTRRMSQPDMESIFTKIIYQIFCSWEIIM